MKPIYVNLEHEVLITTYLECVYSSIDEIVSDTEKKKDFFDICNVIIEYHNQYTGLKNYGDFYDFLMIIPVNFSTMVSGFLCGYENQNNATIVRIHRQLLSNFAIKVVEDLKKISPKDDCNR